MRWANLGFYFIKFYVGLILNFRNLNWYKRVDPLPPVLFQLLSCSANIMSDCGVISYGKKSSYSCQKYHQKKNYQ